MRHSLAGLDGLHIKSFAKRWKVSTRTVHRDLDSFREMGQRLECERDLDGFYRWQYEPGTEFLFTKNVPRTRRSKTSP